MRSPIGHADDVELGTVGEATVVQRYTTLEEEYRAIRHRAAVLDLSGERLLMLSGEGALDFAQRVLARDVEYLTSERCMTSLVLDDRGAVVDQVVVWGRETGLLIESSVGGGQKLMDHLRGLVGDMDAVISDRSHELTVVGVEGPYSWGVVGRLVDPDLAALPLESVVDSQWDGVPISFARTGFTGEYGYKMLVPRAEVQRLWELATAEAAPAGQRALEVAMLEVRQPLVHRETTGADVLTTGLNWLVDITKDDFVGRDAVLAAFEAPSGLRTVGFTAAQPPPAGSSVTVDGQKVGEVVHAVHSLGLDAALGLLRVPDELAAAGLHLTVGGVEVTTLTSPYVTPRSWTTPIL